MSKPKADSAVAMLVRSDSHDGQVPIEMEKRRKQEHTLHQLFERLTNHKGCSLAPCMLAQWKPGLKNRITPAYGDPVVVVSIIDPPVFDSTFGSGSPYYREPLGLVLGETDDNGEFLLYHYDIRRFEPYISDIFSKVID